MKTTPWRRIGGDDNLCYINFTSSLVVMQQFALTFLINVKKTRTVEEIDSLNY
jgi:hypothetical protein